MQGGAVARRYALALLGLAQESGALEQLDAESKVVGALLNDRHLRAFFAAPQIPRERKRAALEAALRGKAHPLLLNLARLLVDRGRMAFLPAIMAEFDRLTDELRGVEEVTIVSAVPLSEQEQRHIEDGLLRFSAYGTLRVKTQVDRELLGGVLVKLGSRVLDSSLASRLAELRQALVASSQSPVVS